MNQTRLILPEIKLVGTKKIKTSTNAEFDPQTSQIGKVIQEYFQNNYASKIQHRKNLGRTFAVYFEYESDYKGQYSYFIGEEVTEFGIAPQELESYTIQSQTYDKFTTEAGAMPNVVINAWQEIWQMDDKNRTYQADFEIYDQRAQDPTNTILDIYIGMRT